MLRLVETAFTCHFKQLAMRNLIMKYIAQDSSPSLEMTEHPILQKPCNVISGNIKILQR